MCGGGFIHENRQMLVDVVKGQEDFELGGRMETIQTIALLKTARILRGVLET